MKLLLLLAVGLAAKADILRLRDGRMFTGNFLGATRSEIWFQADGQIVSASAFPVAQVESLTFGPAPKQASVDDVAVKPETPPSRPSEPLSRRP